MFVFNNPKETHLRIDLKFFSVHEEINSKMLRKGVYHIFEFISNEPNKKL
jgi:hypothetical protein